MKTKFKNIQAAAIEFKKSKTHAEREQYFTVLYKKTKPRLRSFLYNYLSKTTDKNAAIDEVLSRTYIKVWERIHQYKPEFAFTTWLFTIAKNEALRYLESESVSSLNNILDAGAQFEGENYNMFELEEQEEAFKEKQIMYQKVLEFAEELPEKYKVIFKKYYLENYKEKEIAEALGLPLGTVKTRKRAVKKYISEAFEKNIKVYVY